MPDSRAPGGRSTLAYRFAARSECVLCHNPWIEARTTVFGVQSASPLALGAAQLDRDAPGAEAGDGENQLRRLERLGYFARPHGVDGRAGAPRLADPYDAEAGLDARARAYLQVNCAHCHSQHAGGTALIALGATLTLDQTRTVGARPVQGTFGIDDARIIAPGEPERSVLYYRMAKTGAGRMPRLGSQRVDERGLRLIADWIAHDGPSAPGPARRRAADPEAIRRMTGSTREALGLVRLIEEGAIPPATLERDRGPDQGPSPRRDPRPVRTLRPRTRASRAAGRRDRARRHPRAQGRRRAGPEWYFAETATQCKSCHRIGGVGVELGPDLDAIGSKYPKPELLGHILQPARTIDPRYALQVIETKDGRVHQGLLVEQAGGLLVLRDAQNRTTRIAATEIERQATQPASLMPEGLLARPDGAAGGRLARVSLLSERALRIRPRITSRSGKAQLLVSTPREGMSFIGYAVSVAQLAKRFW